jgi:hypothetical protein
MTVMLTELYDALRAAEGVGDDRARKAAEAVASYEQRFAGLDVKLEEMKGSMRVMQWMLGTLIAGTAALLIKAFA